jgi:hypothetical protein
MTMNGKATPAAAKAAVIPAVTFPTANAKKQTKAQQQANAAHALLLKGPVTVTQLKKINAEYPGDVIAAVKKHFNVNPIYRKKIDGVLTYSLTPFPAAAAATPAVPKEAPRENPGGGTKAEDALDALLQEDEEGELGDSGADAEDDPEMAAADGSDDQS